MSRRTLLKMRLASTIQAMLNPVVCAPFSSVLAGYAQEQLL
jgi:hypothetical protein